MFDEPREFVVSRYSKDTRKIGVFEYALMVFNHEMGYEYFPVDISGYGFDNYSGLFPQLAGGATQYLFDVIEYQWVYLSKKEKVAFSKQLNALLKEYDIPWIIVDGLMTKIDSTQFEMDLKNKTNELFAELKDDIKDFQPAYDELQKAFEFYNKQEYSEVILYSNKSYESVIKVVLNKTEGNAATLTSDVAAKLELPASIGSGAFKEKVLMSLPFMRNATGGHGSGSVRINVSKELANLSINFACSLITFLIEEYKKRGGENA